MCVEKDNQARKKKPGMAAAWTLLSTAAAACSFDSARPGLLRYGGNDGGCYSCVGTDAAPLSGATLEAACKSVCADDSQCEAFETSPPAGHDAYLSSSWGYGINCCIEHATFASARNVFDAGNSGLGSDCRSEMNCWTTHVKRSSGATCASSAAPMPAGAVCTRNHEPDDAASMITMVDSYVQGGCVWDEVSWPSTGLCGAPPPSAAPPSWAGTSSLWNSTDQLWTAATWADFANGTYVGSGTWDGTPYTEHGAYLSSPVCDHFRGVESRKLWYRADPLEGDPWTEAGQVVIMCSYRDIRTTEGGDTLIKYSSFRRWPAVSLESATDGAAEECPSSLEQAQQGIEWMPNQGEMTVSFFRCHSNCEELRRLHGCGTGLVPGASWKSLTTSADMPTGVWIAIGTGTTVLVIMMLSMVVWCRIRQARRSVNPPTASLSTTQRPAEMPAAMAMAGPSSTTASVSENEMGEMMAAGQVPVVTGVLVQDEPLLTLAEQVELMKAQLGISGGDVPTVVHQAAKQLGIDTGGRPLIEISRECARALGARC